MSEPYQIDRTSNQKRRDVEAWLFGLDLVSPGVRDNIVTAWVSSWASSPYETLESMPFSAGIDYPLMQHVNEVTRAGMDLAKRAAADWKVTPDPDILVPILILHDVDKPLMYVRDGAEIKHSTLYHELSHGVVGAMMLKELGFPHHVVSTVALHAGNAPYHGRTFEAFLLHYADYFSADHAMMTVGKKPTYQK
jgi:putative nucleotidyltransferase with HDIG domain